VHRLQERQLQMFQHEKLAYLSFLRMFQALLLALFSRQTLGLPQLLALRFQPLCESWLQFLRHRLT
jgi:hypothetical protein